MRLASALTATMMLMGGAVVAAGIVDDDGTAAASQQPTRLSPSRFQSHTPAPETLQPEPVAGSGPTRQEGADLPTPELSSQRDPQPAPTQAQDDATELPLPHATPDLPSTDVSPQVAASAPEIAPPSSSRPSHQADRTDSQSPTPPDRAAPQTAIDSGPASRDDSRAQFTFHASERSSFVCSLDGAGFRACESGVRYDHLQPGWHEFAVRATDPAGNAEASPARYRWHTSAGGWAEDQVQGLLHN